MSISKPSPVVTKNDGRTVGKSFKSLGFVLFTLVTVGSIEACLAYLQVIEGSHLYAKAESNRIRMVPKQPERGNIFDCNGKVFASTKYRILWRYATNVEILHVTSLQY